MMDSKGQISGEYLLLTGVLILVLMVSLVFIAGENELNIAMQSARNGAIDGATSQASAIYAQDSFDDYGSKSSLLHPFSVDIVNISYTDMGVDNNYAKHKIQFKVYAHVSGDYDNDELVSIGDRINYNLRKSLAQGFNTTQATNKLYNPVFSQHYVFTTANVKWV